jgi:hypothetical protein
MPEALTDLVDVRSPEAFLDADRALVRRALLAEEVGLELVHPGVRQEKRRIVRNERGGRDARVPALFKERGESIPDLLGIHVLGVLEG